MKQPDCRSQRGKEAEGGKSINECSYEKAVRTARLQKAECRSRRQEAAVSASMRKQIEAARLQKGEGRMHNSECSFEQADRIVDCQKAV